MDEFQIQLQKKIKELTSIVTVAEKCMKEAPEGVLRISKNQNTIQYYNRTNPEDKHGKYIRKSELELIQQLAQKDYAKRIHTNAIREINNLKDCQKKYNPETFIDIYNKLTEPKQNLVNPYVLTDEQFIKQWRDEKELKKASSGKNDLALIPEDESIITEQGERVRSKSEKILADKLYMMKIPYVYECPLYINGYGYVNPDFTVLNCNTRREYIWEHFGLMDNKEYCENAIKKIEQYERNHIYTGKNLILSYETEKHHINTKAVERLIKEYLM